MALAACILWSTAFVGIKIGIQYSPPLQFAGIRFIIAGLMIVPFVGLSKIITELKRSYRIVALVTILQTVVHYTLFYLGMERVPGAAGAILIGAGPLFITVAAHLGMKDDKLSVGKIVGLIVGFIGIVFVSFGTKEATPVEESANVILGICLLLAVNMNSGLSNIILKKSSGKISPLVLSSTSMFFGGIIIFSYSFIFEDFAGFSLPAPYYFSLLWLSFLSAAAVSMWFTALHRPQVKISNLNMWKFIIPIIGAALSWFLLPENSLNILTIVGVIITTTSLLVTNYYNRKSALKVGNREIDKKR